MSTNRFHKPDPKPISQTAMFRCEYIGNTTFEVEAEDEAEAETTAEELLRESHGAFVIKRLGPVKPEKRVGPVAWQAALALAGGGMDFGRIHIEVGSTRWWLTNGEVALLASGEHPPKSLNMIAYGIGEKLEPTAASRGVVRMGPELRLGPEVWVQERYLWLVEELFGECSWHVNEKDTNSFSLVAVRNGEVVAVLMRYLVREKVTDAEPFVGVGS